MHFRALGSVAASSSCLCPDCTQSSYVEKGWENGRELGKLSRTPSQNFNSGSHCNISLLRVFWECRVFLGLLLPQVASPCLLSALYPGDVFSECPFPTGPWEHCEGAAVLAFPLPLWGEAWVHRLLSHTWIVHLKHSLLGSAFWLSDQADRVRIGVHLGVCSYRDSHMISLCKDTVFKSI